MSVKVFLTCDLDPDQATQANPERSRFTWKGLDLLPQILDELLSRKMLGTLFVRSDAQIKTLFGDALYLFKQFKPVLDDAVNNGFELGWHPHLYKEVQNEFLPLQNSAEACAQLQQIFTELQSASLRFSSVRVGEAWHSTEMMRLLDAMGFEVDSTALPGRKRDDAARSFDWSSTPNEPYHPCTSDYRTPGSQKLKILEVPMTTSLIKTSYDKAPTARYLNPTFRPELFKAGLENYLGAFKSSKNHSLVIIFHPGELLPQPENGLHVFGWDNFVKNLSVLEEVLNRRKGPFEFLTTAQAASQNWS